MNRSSNRRAFVRPGPVFRLVVAGHVLAFNSIKVAEVVLACIVTGQWKSDEYFMRWHADHIIIAKFGTIARYMNNAVDVEADYNSWQADQHLTCWHLAVLAS